MVAGGRTVQENMNSARHQGAQERENTRPGVRNYKTKDSALSQINVIT